MHRGRSGDGAATHAPVVVVAVSRARITIISRPRAAPEKFAVDCDGGGEIVTFRNCDDRCLSDALTAAQCSAERTGLLAALVVEKNKEGVGKWVAKSWSAVRGSTGSEFVKQ